jgi:chaperone modulatory protein CbpM
MKKENLIEINKLCTQYEVELSFFEQIEQIGLIEISTFTQHQYLHKKHIDNVEKVLRLHNDLKVNMEGIDVIFNLLDRITILQEELIQLKNRLNIYENE